MALVARSGIEHPEGWFLPETYQFTRGDSDRDVLVRAHAAMQQALAEAWECRDLGLPIDSPYELLILASIIEKETSLDEEAGAGRWRVYPQVAKEDAAADRPHGDLRHG